MALHVDGSRMARIDGVTRFLRLRSDPLADQLSVVAAPFAEAVRAGHFDDEKAVAAFVIGPTGQLFRGHKGFGIVGAGLLRGEAAISSQGLAVRVELINVIGVRVAKETLIKDSILRDCGVIIGAHETTDQFCGI